MTLISQISIYVLIMAVYGIKEIIIVVMEKENETY